MPKVRFQLESLTCAKTEDRGLLDSRSEDEIYIHGAVAAGSVFKALMVGEPVDSVDAPFRHLKIVDGQTVTFPESEDTTWTVELPEAGQIEIGFTVHEEDALRQWPTVASLRSDLTEAISKAFNQSVATQRAFEAKNLVAASTDVMRSQEKFNVDDLIGEVAESFYVADLTPETFVQTRQLGGGSRVLASDFLYSVSFRVSRDDRDYAVELLSPGEDSVSLLPGTGGNLSIRFKNTGRATISASDIALMGPSDLAGWLADETPRIIVDDGSVGLLPAMAEVAPGEELTFELALAAPPMLGRASFPLRLCVPSLKHFVAHPPIELSLSSGREIVCEIETIANNGGLDADLKVMARDAITNEVLEGAIRVTGEETLFVTSQPFKVHSNMRHLMANPVQKGQDQIVWPFGSVQVDGYWPQLLTLRPV